MGKHSMNFFDWSAFILLIVGGLNWLLVNDFNFNLVTALLGVSWGSWIVYNLVGVSAIYGIYTIYKLAHHK